MKSKENERANIKKISYKKEKKHEKDIIKTKDK